MFYGSPGLSLISKMAATFSVSISRQEERGRSSSNHITLLLGRLPFTSSLLELGHMVTPKEE